MAKQTGRGVFPPLWKWETKCHVVLHCQTTTQGGHDVVMISPFLLTQAKGVGGPCGEWGMVAVVVVCGLARLHGITAAGVLSLG